MKQVYVKVMGKAGSGKSTIADFITKALRDYQIKVTVEETVDGPFQYSEGALAVFRNSGEVIIEEIQLGRLGSVQS